MQSLLPARRVLTSRPRARTLTRMAWRRFHSPFDRLDRRLHFILTAQESIMATLADLTTAVANQRVAIDSAVALLGTLSTGSDPAAVQAVVDDIDANTKTLTDAVAAHTPTAPAP